MGQYIKKMQIKLNKKTILNIATNGQAYEANLVAVDHCVVILFSRLFIHVVNAWRRGACAPERMRIVRALLSKTRTRWQRFWKITTCFCIYKVNVNNEIINLSKHLI